MSRLALNLRFRTGGAYHWPLASSRVAPIALATLLLGWLAPSSARAGELGAFFVPSTMSAFEQGPRQGARVPLKPGIAYSVIGLGWEGGERMWLRLSVPERQQEVRGEGWTPLTADELAARGTGPVDIYARPIEPGGVAASGAAASHPGASNTAVSNAIPISGPASVQVPANQVQFRGEGQVSKALPHIAWRPVRYTNRRAEQPWIAATQGVYRPGRTPVFLMTASQEMVSKNIPADSIKRLLSGVVRIGDSVQDVRWAWGEPLRTWSEGADNQKQAVWEYAEGQLRFTGAAVAEVR